MHANVLPMRPLTVSPGEAERISALYVALSVMPEIRFASSVVRQQIVDKVIAGMRTSARGFNPRDETDRNGFMEAVTLLAHDKEQAVKRGWLW